MLLQNPYFYMSREMPLTCLVNSFNGENENSQILKNKLCMITVVNIPAVWKFYYP